MLKLRCKRSAHLSPIKLSGTVLEAKSKDDLKGSALDGFDALRVSTERDGDALFSVLRRLELVHGPTERAFEDELCQTHLPTLSQCSGLSARSLAKVLNSLIGLLERAASFQSNDPLRHCVGLTSTDEVDPYLLGKRVCADDVTLAIRDACDIGFQYPEELATLSFDKDQSTSDRAQKETRSRRIGISLRGDA